MKKMLGMLAAVVLLGASLSFAQTPDNPNPDRGTATSTTQNTDNNRGNWGWLGLLGLLGLGGLRGRRQYTSDNEREVVTNIRKAA